jgi:uncharacterized protein YjbI with pentapeptide repeats
MAKTEHLDVVLNGMEALLQWRSQHPMERLQLYEADLSNCNLEYMDLSESSLVNANLERANLNGAKLMRADMTGASFRLATLHSANLMMSVLADSDLRGADLQAADLSGADLDSARLQNARLVEVDLIQTLFRNTNVCGSDWSRARVGNTVFAATDLSRVQGLDSIIHLHASTVGTDSLEMLAQHATKAIISFLLSCGVTESFISSLEERPN